MNKRAFNYKNNTMKNETIKTKTGLYISNTKNSHEVVVQTEKEYKNKALSKKSFSFMRFSKSKLTNLIYCLVHLNKKTKQMKKSNKELLNDLKKEYAKEFSNRLSTEKNNLTSKKVFVQIGDLNVSGNKIKTLKGFVQIEKPVVITKELLKSLRENLKNKT